MITIYQRFTPEHILCPLLLASILCLHTACDDVQDDKSGEVDLTQVDIIESGLINATRTQDRTEIGVLSFGGGVCTATLITPRVAVTARHCVDFTTCDDASCVQQYNAFLVLEDRSARPDFYDVVAFTSFDERGRLDQGESNTGIDYLNTNRSDYWTSDDVALILLAAPVPASVASPSALTASAPARGDDLSVWGYGCTQRGTQSDIAKRYRDFVEGIGRSDNLCPGDSGGPVTLGRDGEVLYVNSGYTVPQLRGQVSRDIYGDALALRPFLLAELARWGESSSPVAPGQGPSTPPDATPSPVIPAPVVVESTAPIRIPDRGAVSRVANISVARTLSTVSLELDLAHSSPLDLAFVLTSPSGTRVVFQQPGQDNSTRRVYTLTDFSGEQAQGQWTVEFYDVYARDTGSVQRIKLTFD